MVYGYVRVSSQDQNEARQLDAMHSAGVPPENVYVDHQSGKDFNRPSYLELVGRLQEGDVLYIHSIDRLGRNYEEILDQWRELTKHRKVDISVIDMPLLDTRHGNDLMGTFIADLVLQVLSFVAQNEREAIRQRQAEGIAAAQARGVRFGRPPRPVPDNFYDVLARWEHGEISLNDAARLCEMPRGTFYSKAIRERRNRVTETDAA